MQDNPKYGPYVEVERLLRNKIGKDYQTLLLFTGKKPILRANENLVNIGKWILGSSLDKNKTAIPSEELEFEVKTFENLSFIKPTLIFYQKYIIISVDLSALTSDKQEQAFNEVLLLIFILENISRLTTCNELSIYGAFNGNVSEEEEFEKNEEDLRDFVKGLNIGIVIFNYDDEFDKTEEVSRLKIDKRIPEAQHCIYSTNIIFKTAKNSFSLLIETLTSDKWTPSKLKGTNKTSNKRIKQECQTIIYSITQTFISIVKPVETIIKNTVGEAEDKNGKIFSLVTGNLRKESRNISNIEVREVKLEQSENKYPSLAFKWFAIQFFKLLDNFKGENSQAKYEEFFHLFFVHLEKLPLESSIEDLQFLYSYAKELMNINKTLENIFKIEPNLQSILNSIWQNLEISSEIMKISISVKKTKMANDESAGYYLKFEELMNDLLNCCKLEQTEKTEIEANLKDLQSQLPLLKARAILNSENESTEVIKSIKLFFEDYFKPKNPNSLNDDNIDLIIIFFKSAEYMRKCGLTMLALELYKKIKFFNKIEECAKEISRRHKKEPVKLEKFYSNLSDYFACCRKFEEAVKYSQLAYESNICLESMKKMAEMRYLMENKASPPKEMERQFSLTKEISLTKEMDVITKLAQTERTSKPNVFEYCNYDFPDNFPELIQKMSVKIKENEDTSTAVEITKKDLNKILKFQADDDDDQN